MLISARSWEEYVAMFDLSPADLDGTVVDCAAGASSFVAETNARGGDTVAVDPLYSHRSSTLAQLAAGGLRDCLEMMESTPHAFVWDWYGSLERRERLRQDAAARFVADLQQHPDRYVAAGLPDLPFTDASVDLALCSHLLFSWDQSFDRAWHLAALRELARVARREARVFPLVGHTDRGAYPHLEWLQDRLRHDGIATEQRTVPYEFQRGADTMLVLRPA